LESTTLVHAVAAKMNTVVAKTNPVIAEMNTVVAKTNTVVVVYGTVVENYQTPVDDCNMSSVLDRMFGVRRRIALVKGDIGDLFSPAPELDEVVPEVHQKCQQRGLFQYRTEQGRKVFIFAYWRAGFDNHLIWQAVADDLIFGSCDSLPHPRRRGS
jgi:hypothetical protein